MTGLEIEQCFFVAAADLWRPPLRGMTLEGMQTVEKMHLMTSRSLNLAKQTLKAIQRSISLHSTTNKHDQSK